MEFDYCGQVNGQSFSRVVFLPAATRAYGMKKQPPPSAIRTIFENDILPTFEKYRVATSYDEVHKEYVMHAVSCTSAHLGFSTGYRDTIFKVVESTLYVFHHHMRTHRQYERLMDQFYPSGIERLY